MIPSISNALNATFMISEEKYDQNYCEMQYNATYNRYTLKYLESIELKDGYSFWYHGDQSCGTYLSGKSCTSLGITCPSNCAGPYVSGYEKYSGCN